MKRISIVFLTLSLACCLFQCSKGPQGPVDSDDPHNQLIRELTAAEKKLAQSTNSFGFKLFRGINGEKLDEDLFISPLSVSFALGMAYNGADGDTRDAIQNTLELTGLTHQEINDSYKSLIEFLTTLDPDVTFQIANSMWYRLGFPIKEEFINTNKTYFDAEVAGLDFNNPSAVKVINDWVSKKTHEKITNIIDPPIDPLTMLFLINAIYFKGTWQDEFDTSLTYDGVFNLLDGSNSTCKMMYQENGFYYFENEEFQAIDLPYGDSVFSMTIFLPNQQTNINDFANRFSEDNYQIWLGNLESKFVRLSMPKFKLECEMTLNNILASLGMGIAFSLSADFSNIADMILYISQVRHKTFIEVDESGTEAAAVTAITISTTSINPNEIFMTINRPFIFMIRENNSNTILFMGKIIEPTL